MSSESKDRMAEVFDQAEAVVAKMETAFEGTCQAARIVALLSCLDAEATEMLAECGQPWDEFGSYCTNAVQRINAEFDRAVLEAGL